MPDLYEYAITAGEGRLIDHGFVESSYVSGLVNHAMWNNHTLIIEKVKG